MRRFYDQASRQLRRLHAQFRLYRRAGFGRLRALRRAWLAL